MIAILLAGGISLALASLLTPIFIKVLVKFGYGQFIREDGPTSHHTKRGTPTMGGAVIIFSVLVGYLLTKLLLWQPVTSSALSLLFLITGLGFIGLLDDFTKISKQRSLGISAKAKLFGQGFVGTVFAVLVLQFPNAEGVTAGSTSISFIGDSNINLAFFGAGTALVLFVIWCNVIVASASNAANLTDGLDGLATGALVMVFGAFTLIGIWQADRKCGFSSEVVNACYEVRDPLDLAMVSFALTGACIGFLWWNTSPAKIFMGDTGSLALGAAMAGLAILLRVELLLVLLAGLFVLITISVILQVGFYKLTGRRIFKMAPLQHHFELKGWAEVTVVVRFWIICAVFVALALGVFYADWVVRSS